jgi:hypothetical protein
MGGLLAVWALTVSFLGITRENFPTTKGAERAVMVISAVLFLSAVGTAILTAIQHEEHQEHEEKGEEHALILRD